MRTSGKLSGVPTGSSAKSSFTGTTAVTEDVGRMQQDLVLLTQKIADITGEPQRAPTAPIVNDGALINAPNSPFVAGIRGLAESASISSSGGSDGADLKLSMLEKVLKKIVDLDRLLLQKTAPESDPSRTNARRGSRGMDLFSLPTHLHVTDRLMDLYSQSKRVVTVTKTAVAPESDASSIGGSETSGSHGQPRPPNNAGPVSPRGSGADKDALKKSALELAALRTKLEESEAKRAAVKEDCASARKENLAYKKELEAANRAAEELRLTLGTDDRNAKIRALEARVAELEGLTRSMQEQVEVEAARAARAVDAVTQNAASIKMNHQEYGNSPQKDARDKDSGAAATNAHDSLLGTPMSHALRLLTDAVKSRIGSMNEQLLSMNIVKESLETDVQTLQMSQEIVNKDFLTVQQELQSMRTAFSALQAEALGNDSAVKLERANNLLIDMQAEVAAAHRRTLDLERLPATVAELEAKLRTLELRTTEQSGEIGVLSGELQSYKKMAEGLKQKIRELSSKGGAESKDFMDSFEEVMKDEMYTMKLAFEAKLKAKADEVAALANRHAIEINRIQANASPYIRR
jgi:uncharacterized coiled-coil protein SlyX